MTDKMWFGYARGHMQYVPCPLIDSSVTRNRYVERIQFENGGGDGRRSNQYQMQYDFAFSGLAHEVDGIDAFNKYAQGFYGDDLIHLAHPAAFETNLFPAGWATPSLAEKGWGKISSDAVAYSNADGPMITNLVTNPSMEGVTAGTDSTKRTNLVTNPSFETDTTGWYYNTSGIITRTTAEKYIGTASMAFYSDATDRGPRTNIPVTTANAVHTFSAWVKAPVGTLLSAIMHNTSTGGQTTNFVGTGEWQRVSATYAALGTNQMFAYIATRQATPVTFYVDAAMVEISPEARSYFDGTYAEDPTLIPAWTGTVNNSTSTALVRGASNRENLVTNPSFEVDTTGWTGRTSATISRDTTNFYTGSASLKVVTVGTAAQGAQFALNGTTAGIVYVASAWVKMPAGVSYQFYFGDNVVGGSTNDYVGTGAWQRVTATRTALTTSMMPLVWFPNAHTGQTFYIDAVMVEASSTVGPYFDGSYTDAPGWATSWAGTANASRSVATAAPVTVRTNLVTNPSMESVTTGTVVMRRNLSTNPRAITGLGGWSNNNGAMWATSFVTSLPVAHPLGITTAVRSNVISGLSSPTALSLYNIDTLGNTTTSRLYGVWVLVMASGYQASIGGITPVPLTSGVWTYLKMPSAATGWSGVEIYKITGSAVSTDIAYATGCIVELGSVGDYFDGSTTDALGWDYAWSGTANASISTAACAATTVRTNLVTNPNSETSNIAPAGNGAGTASLSTTQKVSGTNSTKFVWTSGNWGAQPVNVAVTAGTTYTASFYIFSESGSIPSFVVQNQNYATVASTGVYTTSTVGSWVRLNMTFTPAAGTTSVLIYGTTTSAATYYIDNVLVETALTLGDYFDGSLSPAGDFSFAWTGTANASTSIARGAAVAGYNGYGSAAIQSMDWSSSGTKSMRLIPTSQNVDTFFDLSVSTTVGATYTVSVKCRLTAAQTGTLEAYARSFAKLSPTTRSNQAPNAAGTTKLTLTFVANSTTSTIRFINGAFAGNGDVWWDELMVEASPIVQDYFDGSVVSADADLTNSWSGTAHASTSLKRGVGVNATAGNNAAAAIQSTKWKSTGSSSLRIIPLATQSDSFASIDMPVASTMAGKTYTILAKIRLAAPLTGTLEGRALKFYGVVNLSGGGEQIVTASVGGNNVAGEQQYRATITVPATATTWSLARLYNGASAGNGDVWWDDLLVVQGTYTGDYFDGNSTDSGNTTYNWTGTANASTSTMLSEMVLYGNPPRATTYTVTNINQPPTKVCTLVIPPEYTLYLGASGTSTGSAGVFIRPIQASDSLYYGPLEELTLLDPNGNVRMNKTLNGATYQAVEIFLMKTDAAAATVTLNSMMAQLYKTGTTPALPTNHYQGEGSTGLMFADDAIVETYSYMHPPRKGIATTLIEVEAWR